MHQSLCKKPHEGQVNDNRFNYCGTCKSIGSSMGQPSRFVLNYDIVFLSALLNEFSSESKYAGAYFEKSCWKLPDPKSIPLVFQYTSALNIYLASIKIQDNILDSKWWDKPKWLFTKLFLMKSFKKAERTLRDLNFPLDTVKSLIKRNWKNETTKNLRLEEYSEPTAQITKISFEHGAALLNINEQDRSQLGKIGYALGEMAYCMDAEEDLSMDKLNANFNPLIANSSISKEQIRNRVVQYTDSMIEQLSSLNISNQLKSRYILLLSSLNSSEDPKENKKKESTSCLDGCCSDCCCDCSCDCCVQSCCDCCVCGG